uniref:Uncharacterized protein n=2 Tax=Anguilla anguilla TaxID=7936 RepID=A0A0E9PE51_ANGAN
MAYSCEMSPPCLHCIKIWFKIRIKNKLRLTMQEFHKDEDPVHISALYNLGFIFECIMSRA